MHPWTSTLGHGTYSAVIRLIMIRRITNGKWNEAYLNDRLNLAKGNEYHRPQAQYRLPSQNCSIVRFTSPAYERRDGIQVLRMIRPNLGPRAATHMTRANIGEMGGSVGYCTYGTQWRVLALRRIQNATASVTHGQALRLVKHSWKVSLKENGKLRR